MYWIHFIVTVFLFQSSIGLSIPRSRRQQTQGSLYGNSNPSQGFNTNYYGTNLNNNNNNNNQAAKDLYGNPLVPGNTGVGMNNMGLPNQQQQQQQQQQLQQAQIYGPNGQPIINPSYGTGNAFQPSGTNQVNTNLGLRDANGNPLPSGQVQGAPGSSLYSPSNPHLNYPGNTNQNLLNKELYNPAANPNNNNQYGSNNNQYPYGSSYNGQQVPQNTNNNVWPGNNNNNNNQYNPNAWNQNRQVDANTNNNNQYSPNVWNQNRPVDATANNNNQVYSNPNSPYFYNANSACQLFNSFSLFILSFIAIIFFHIY